MVVALVAGVLGFCTVVVAWYREDAVLERAPAFDPGFGPLPAPNDVARPSFPIAFQGYDPAAVDATLDALLVAYEELYVAAGPETRDRARRGAARRRGQAADAPTTAPATDPGADAQPIAAAGSPAVVEALRAAAALGAIEHARRRRRR